MIQRGAIPFVRILIPLILGIGIGLSFIPSFQTEIYFKIALLALFLLYFGFELFYTRSGFYKIKWMGGLLVFLIFCLSGFILLINKSERNDPYHFSRFQSRFLAATIITEPKVSGDILRFVARVSAAIDDDNSQPVNGNLLVALKLNRPDKIAFQYGDLILIPAFYNEVEPPYNPSEFDFKEYLSHQSVFHQTFINERQIKILKRHQGNSFIDFAIRLRQRLVVRFNHFIKNKDAAAVASTLILGYRATLSPEIINAYSATGTMHVLSVSGMHVGIIFLVLGFLLKGMQRTRLQRLVRSLILLLFIWAYALVTGFSPAVCRAVLMLSFIIIGKAVNRSLNTYNLLAISAVLLLIYNPFFLVDVGFQLSYLAVAGLVYFYPKIYHSVSFKNKICEKIWSYLSVSMAAQLATFPVAVYYFHQFPVYFLISNLFIILPVAVIMYAGLVFILLPINAISYFLGWFLDKSISLTNQVLHFIENLPFSLIRNIWINTWEYLLIYGLIFLLILFFNHKKRILMNLSLLFVLILTLSVTVKNIQQQRMNRIIFFSLRKESAIGFVEGQKGILLSNLHRTGKTFSFSVEPAFTSEKVYLKADKAFDTVFREGNLFSNGNFLQFRNWKLFICDTSFNRVSTRNKITVNAVLVRNNCRPDLSALLKALKFHLLIIDGSNSDYNIYHLQQQAQQLNLTCYVLKKNPAYIVNL